jgi:hypothetical protein
MRHSPLALGYETGDVERVVDDDDRDDDRGPILRALGHKLEADQIR